MVGAATETGVLDGEADTEDPDGVVAGEAVAAGLGDANGLGKGLGEGATCFDVEGVVEAFGPLSRDDDSPGRASIDDFAVDLLFAIAEPLALFCPALLPPTLALCELAMTRLAVAFLGWLSVVKSPPTADRRDDPWVVEDEGAGPAASAIRLTLVRLAVSALLGCEPEL